MSNTTNTPSGFTPDFEAYVVARAAKLIAGGAGEHEALKEAMIATLAFYNEIAQGQTARAKAFQRDAARRIWESVRA